MSRRRPPLLLRLAVVVGAFTFLLGLVGVVLMMLRDDASASAAGPGLGERVRVVDARGNGARRVGVRARWQEGEVHHLEAARPLSSAAGVYLLPPGLVGREIVIEVLDDAGEVQASRTAVPRRAQEIRVEVGTTPER